MEFLIDNYLVIKAFHIISIIAWMAGMLYLPRLFVYHSTAEKGSELSETLKIMERKLLRFIINPAMIAAWVFGISMLIADTDLFQSVWMHVKLTSIVFMMIFYHVLLRWRKKFEKDENIHSEKFFRMMNEVPTLLMVIIVLCAVIKPF